MQLFYSPASPFVRKVMVVLHEAGIADHVELVGSTKGPTDTTFVSAANPLGKIPTLARPDGPALYDSRVICRYLDDTYKLGLYPETGLYDVLTLEATGDGLMEAAVLMIYEHRFRPEDKIHDPWLDRQWEKVSGALSALEQRWMSLLAGPLNAGQISVGCALGYLDFRHGDKEWRKFHTSLDDWYAEFSTRESMRLTAPPDT